MRCFWQKLVPRLVAIVLIGAVFLLTYDTLRGYAATLLAEGGDRKALVALLTLGLMFLSSFSRSFYHALFRRLAPQDPSRYYSLRAMVLLWGLFSGVLSAINLWFLLKNPSLSSGWLAAYQLALPTLGCLYLYLQDGWQVYYRNTVSDRMGAYCQSKQSDQKRRVTS